MKTHRKEPNAGWVLPMPKNTRIRGGQKTDLDLISKKTVLGVQRFE